MSSMCGDNDSLLVQDVVDDEYSTNFFGFTSNDVCNGVMKSIAPCAIADSIARLKQCLLQKFKGHETEIESACTLLLDESLAAVPGLLRPLKDLTEIHFKIPKNVLLEQDLIQSDQYDEDDERRMDMEIGALEGRVTKASFVEAYLEEELDLAAKFNEIVDASNTVDFANKIANIGASSASIQKLNDVVKNPDLEEKKRKLMNSKESHKAGLEAIRQKGHRKIYEAPL